MYKGLKWKFAFVDSSWANQSDYAVDIILFRKDPSNENIITATDVIIFTLFHYIFRIKITRIFQKKRVLASSISDGMVLDCRKEEVAFHFGLTLRILKKKNS